MPIMSVDEIRMQLGIHNNQYAQGLLFKADYVNYTPLMLGDYQGRHFRCLDPLCSHIAPSLGLVAQAIRGKARWLARITLTSLRGCKGRDYHSIEKHCGELIVGIDKSKGRVIRAGLIEIMFGSLDSTQLASPFILKALPKEIRSDYSHSFCGGGKHLPSRVRLITMGKKSAERKLLCPWRPGSFKVSISVELAPHWFKLLDKLDELNPYTTISLRLIPCLYAALIVSTPLLLGIGKATTRGFGRFRIENINQVYNASITQLCSTKWNQLIDALRYLQAEKSSKAADPLKRLIEGLLRISSEVTGLKVDKTPGLENVPRLSYALHKATVVRAAGAHTFEEAIIAIGEAVLKQRWKKVSKMDRGSGLGFHTWPLGLPRKSELRCICKKKDIRDKKKKHAYGYVVVTEDIAKKLIGNNAEKRLKSDGALNKCVISRYCGVNSLTVEELVENNVVLRSANIEQKAKDVRHVSSLILFPLPGEPCMIAMLPLLAYSMNLGVDQGAPSAVPGLILLHVGGHFVKDKEDKPTPCCNAHVVAVSYAASQQTVSNPEEQPKNNLCGCGWDRAGIKEPPGMQGHRVSSSMFEKIVDAAFEWVKYILENGVWR